MTIEKIMSNLELLALDNSLVIEDYTSSFLDAINKFDMAQSSLLLANQICTFAKCAIGIMCQIVSLKMHSTLTNRLGATI